MINYWRVGDFAMEDATLLPVTPGHKVRVTVTVLLDTDDADQTHETLEEILREEELYFNPHGAILDWHIVHPYQSLPPSDTYLVTADDEEGDFFVPASTSQSTPEKSTHPHHALPIRR